MNYDALDKLIPTRRLPDDASVPRDKLFEMFRTLEELRATAVQPDTDKQVNFYERILET